MCCILKSIVRGFVRKPFVNLINLLGLTVSLALVILLSVYCYGELTTDDFHKNVSRLYVYCRSADGFYTPGVLKERMDGSLPVVEASVRIAGSWEAPVFQGGKNEPIVSDLLFADKCFFSVFTYRALEGDLSRALDEPMSVVITQSLAAKLFGRERATGKTFRYNNGDELTVTAVIETPEAQSSLAFSAVTNMETRKRVQPNEGEFEEWGWSNFQTFVLLRKDANPKEVVNVITALFPVDVQKDYANAVLLPLKKLYFSKFDLGGNEYIRTGDAQKTRTLVTVAVLVLLIALVNFINIFSSQWREKIHQTGVMKAIGAKRSFVLGQMLTESILMFLAALFLAMLLVDVLAPLVGNSTGIRFNRHLLHSLPFVSMALLSTVTLGAVFSLVPAWRISSSHVVDNLRRLVRPVSKGAPLTGVLATIQFIVAIVLISFTLLVQKQVRFGNDTLGFRKENILGIKLTMQLESKKDVLKKILEENPFINSVSFGQFYPTKPFSSWSLQVDLSGEKKQFWFDTFSADAGFFELMGLKPVRGRLYAANSLADDHKVVVNESFLKVHHIGNPIGATFNGWDRSKPYEIVGVVKDFHYKSVTQPIGPLVIRNDGYASYGLVRFAASDFNTLKQAVYEIKRQVANLSPAFPVEISFMDQAVENMYQSELQFRRAFTLFAGCAIVLCCMGILAMSLFACQRRVKEIGVRKVNGAKISEVMLLLNRDFVVWIVAAVVVAIPIAWYAASKWLENFAYKTPLSWWIFILSGGLALAIALFTVSWQSWKAATGNPVEALRNE